MNKIIAESAFNSASSLVEVIFKGSKQPIQCSVSAFEKTKAITAIVPKDYKHSEFCGLNISKDLE